DRLGGLAREPELSTVGVVAVALPRNEDAVLRPREVARLREPDILEQLRDALAARPRPHAARQQLRAEQRRRAPALRVRTRRHEPDRGGRSAAGSRSPPLRARSTSPSAADASAARGAAPRAPSAAATARS